MKKTIILVPALLGIALLSQVAQANPTANASAAKPARKPLTLPAEVRAMMAPGATTVSLFLLPIGPKGTPVLLHAWTIGRRSPKTQSLSYAPDLYCVDFFYSNAYTKKKWELAASTAYLSEGGPQITYSVQWLHPAKKQGLVIVETTTQETGGIVRCITLPEGIENQPISQRNAPFVQTFFTSHSGGGSSVFISFGTDKKGDLTVQEEILPHAAVPQTKNTYAWNEDHWAKVASQKIEQH